MTTHSVTIEINIGAMRRSLARGLWWIAIVFVELACLADPEQAPLYIQEHRDRYQ